MQFSLLQNKLWMFILICLIAAVLLLLPTLFSRHLTAHAQGATNAWQDITNDQLNAVFGERLITANRYRSLRLDRATLAATLQKAPMENSNEAKTNPLPLAIPYPDGSFKTFLLVESPIVELELAAKFPEIKTYLGKSKEDPTALARFDLTPKGFHGMILSGKPTVFIDPPIRDNADFYISYLKTDLRKDNWSWECNIQSQSLAQPNATNSISVSNGTQLRTYRLAMAATGEYTAFHGGTVSGAMAAITTSMNRVNAVYERDLSVRMVLIANNNLIVYTNSATDPYTNNSGSTMLGQNRTNLNNVIGSANYDIGHVFSTGGGGIAGLGVVCATNKAYGVTGSSAPVGDGFDIDYVAHEIGHQFGANHTFNGTTGSCGGNRSSGAAYEPGSGTTIMAYAGICGAEDLAAHSDDHFHVKSLEEITTFIASGGTCATLTATNNTLPTISAGSPYTIPVQTPFTLTATGSDPDAGQTLTYCWEQYNLGAASPPNTDEGTRPIFRSFSPTTSPSRTFPKLSDILSNTSTIGESLPTTTRTLIFQVTARDNLAGGGAINTSSVSVPTYSGAGPFTVSSPNTALTWGGGSTQTVTWNVANTDLSPVNCANVKISLSTDGGLTFPIVLLASTPNTGSANVTVPSVTTTQARVKIEAVGNIFFDISNVNFTITGSCATISLLPTSLPDGAVGTVYPSQNITASGGATPYSYALSGGSLPNGLNLTTGGVLSGTPTAHGRFTFSVLATDNSGCTGTQSYTVNITGGGTLTASPTPVPLCNGSNTGTATLSWTSPTGVTSTEIRSGSLAGTVIGTGGASGSVSTGNIVTNNLQFFLINTTGGVNLQLASVTVPATSAACTVTLASNSQLINFPARSINFNVTAPSELSWTAVSNAAWLSVTGGASGMGNGTVTVSAQANTGAARTGTITVGDKTFTVNQKRVKYASTIGIARNSDNNFYLRNQNSTGTADIQFYYGMAGDIPVAGDWDGDGTDTVGIFRNGTFYLRNANSTGFADISVVFGTTGDIPVVGDWNGDGIDTIGIYRNGVFYLRNSNTNGAPDLIFAFGGASDQPIAGDWDGDGIDSVGVFRSSNATFYLRNSNSTGFADLVILYGAAGDSAIAGDWNSDGTDTIGIKRGATLYLRNSNSTGFADLNFVYGAALDVPITGDWNYLP